MAHLFYIPRTPPIVCTGQLKIPANIKITPEGEVFWWILAWQKWMHADQVTTRWCTRHDPRVIHRLKQYGTARTDPAHRHLFAVSHTLRRHHRDIPEDGAYGPPEKQN
jgi:hypothetical protein